MLQKLAVSLAWCLTVTAKWRGAGVVICLERGADLHTVQLMPLPHLGPVFPQQINLPLVPVGGLALW